MLNKLITSVAEDITYSTKVQIKENKVFMRVLKPYLKKTTIVENNNQVTISLLYPYSNQPLFRIEP